VPGERKTAMRGLKAGEVPRSRVVVADVKLDHGRSAKPGKQPHCEYEKEEAGRCRLWRVCSPISPVFSGGLGVAVVSSEVGELGRRRPVSEKNWRQVGTSSSDKLTTRVFFGRAMRRSCQLPSGWLGIVWGW
jgi:hypothetical protein